MFDKLKQVNELRKLRSQALEMQRQLAEEKVEVDEAGIKVALSADQRIQVIEIDGQGQPKLVDVLNKAIRQSQQKAAAKLAQMSGGLSGLLGK